MKSATQLQAEIDAMFPKYRYMGTLAGLINQGDCVVVPAAHYAKLDEDRALWDMVEAHGININCGIAKNEWWSDGLHMASFHGSTPREAVSKAVEAIEEGE